jgi:hypothetical protein
MDVSLIGVRVPDEPRAAGDGAGVGLDMPAILG